MAKILSAMFVDLLLLSGDLGYIDSAILKGIKDEIYEVERMLKALIKSLESKL